MMARHQPIFEPRQKVTDVRPLSMTISDVRRTYDGKMSLDVNFVLSDQSKKL
jgi:hypothetical protein